MDFNCIYWERQGTEHTCGIHTLNSLLQGPHFTKELLTAYAKDLQRMQLSLSLDLSEVLKT